MAYKFKAIEKDKQTYKTENAKTEAANQVFGSYEMGTTDHVDVHERIEDLPKLYIGDIEPREVNNFDPIKNDTLKASILEIGLINPISVRKSGSKYKIISGHRRYEAMKSIVSGLRERKIKGENTPELNREIDFYSHIPALVYEVVEEGNPLIGTDRKYITKATEEKIFEASNLENRQISRKDLTEHILYFYNMVKENTTLRKELLAKRNENAKRNTKKLNVPKVLSQIITQDLGFNVAPSYIWSIVNLIESKDRFPEYHEQVLARIKNGEKVKPAYNDYMMAVEIHEDTHEDTHTKATYEQRILSGKEPVKKIYNEYFGIEEKVKAKMPVGKEQRATLTKLFLAATDMYSLYDVFKKMGYIDKIEAYEH